MLIRLILSLSLMTSISPANPFTQDFINTSYAHLINGMIAMTADDYISTGHYKIGDDSSTYDIYHIPLRHHFKPLYKDVNLYVNGTYSYSKMEGEGHVLDGLPEDDYTARLKLYKLGGGLRYKPSQNFFIQVGYALIYSRLESSYTYNSVISELFVKPFIDDIVNSTQTNWTSEFTLSSQYEYEIKGFTPYIFGEIKWYHTRTDINLDEEYKITSHATIFRAKLGTFTPSIYSMDEEDINLNFFAGRTYYQGDIAAAASSEYYDTFGGGVYMQVKDENAFIDYVGLVSEWARSDHFRGYNIGIDIKFNF